MVRLQYKQTLFGLIGTPEVWSNPKLESNIYWEKCCSLGFFPAQSAELLFRRKRSPTVLQVIFYLVVAVRRQSAAWDECRVESMRCPSFFRGDGRVLHWCPSFEKKLGLAADFEKSVHARD
jgi:hypothetical protein